MTPERPGETTANGYVVNSPIRAKNRRLEGVPVLAGALFAAYGRLSPGWRTVEPRTGEVVQHDGGGRAPALHGGVVALP
jgi:hypothetical protein